MIKNWAKNNKNGAISFLQGLLIAPPPQTEYANIIALCTFVWQPINQMEVYFYDIFQKEKLGVDFWVSKGYYIFGFQK